MIDHRCHPDRYKVAVVKTKHHHKKDVAIPTKFVPQFMDAIDGRAALTREIKRRFEALKLELGCDTYAKELLAQESVFLSVLLETWRCKALETGELDVGVYTHAANALSGLLLKLADKRLDRRAVKALSVKSVVEKYKERSA